MTALLLPNFAHKLTKGFGACQIQRAAGRASVPVSARDERTLPLLRQLPNVLVFFGAARGIDFERMQELPGAAQKSIEIIAASLHSYAGLRPQWMIEHHQHVLEPVKHGQQLI